MLYFHEYIVAQPPFDVGFDRNDLILVDADDRSQSGGDFDIGHGTDGDMIATQAGDDQIFQGVEIVAPFAGQLNDDVVFVVAFAVNSGLDSPDGGFDVRCDDLCAQPQQRGAFLVYTDDDFGAGNDIVVRHVD